MSVAGAVSFFALALTGGAVAFTLLPSIFLGGFLGSLLAPYVVRVVPNRVWRYAIPSYALVIGIVYFAVSWLIGLPWSLYAQWWRELGYGRTSQPLGVGFRFAF